MERGYRNLLLAVICALFSAWLLSGCTRKQRFEYRYRTTIPGGTYYRAIYDTTTITNSVIGFKSIPEGYIESNGYIIQGERKISKFVLRCIKEIRKLNNNCDTVVRRIMPGDYVTIDIFYCRNKIYIIDDETVKLVEITDWRDYQPIVLTADGSLGKLFNGADKYIDIAILSGDPQLFKYILNIYDHYKNYQNKIEQFIFKGKKLEKVNIVEYNAPREIYKGQKYNKEKKRHEDTKVEEVNTLHERLRRMEAGERLWETEPLP